MTSNNGEDFELRDLVMQVLESNGTLGKLKTQLRASVFLALENNSSLKTTSAAKDDSKVEALLKSSEGVDVLGLCRELLAACNLTYTLCVFDSEIKQNLGGSSLPGRTELISHLGISPDLENLPSSAPVLSSLVALQRINSLAERHTVGTDQITNARRCFSRYEKFGCVTYEQLISALAVSFPAVNKKILQDYCADRYQDTNSKSEANIDFEEFLGLYCYFLTVSNFSLDDGDHGVTSIKPSVSPSKDIADHKAEEKIVAKEKSNIPEKAPHDIWEDDKDDDFSLLPKISTGPSSRRKRSDLFDLEKTLDSLNIENDNNFANLSKKEVKEIHPVAEAKGIQADNPDEVASFFNERPPWETEQDYADDFNVDDEQNSPRKVASVSRDDDCKVTDLSDDDEDVTMDEVAIQRTSGADDISTNIAHSPTSSASDFTLNMDSFGKSHYPHLANHPALANVQILEDVERMPGTTSSTKF